MASIVLLVSGDAQMLNRGDEVLSRVGYEVLTASTFAQALKTADYFADADISCVLLDAKLSESGDPLSVGNIREACRAPVLMLLPSDDEQAIALAMRSADDFIAAPYSDARFAARVRVCARNRVMQKATLDFSPLVIHKDGRSASVNGEPLLLTTREFDVLLALAERCNTPVSTEQLYRMVWSEGDTFTPHVVLVNVSTLRKKIERACSLSYISSKRGKGYIFTDRPTPCE